jgi:Ca-activated chloride channel family protein
MRRNKPEIPAATGPGLVTREGAPVPLYGVAIEARVRDGAVLTTVSQRFRNTEKGPIEAVYSFPLEESSAVCGLEIELAGRVLKGMVEEREKAFEKYDEAMRDGNSAFLLDQFRPDIFLVSVGRLQPGEEAVVRITAVSRAESWDRGLRLRIPTTISPRYIPREQARTSDPADLEAILPPTVIGKVPYGLTLEVDIAAGGTIASVSCPSHPVEVSISGKKASVRLAGRDVQLDSDFVLNVELAKPSASRCIACRDGGGYALMIRMKPGVPDEKPGQVRFHGR